MFSLLSPFFLVAILAFGGQDSDLIELKEWEVSLDGGQSFQSIITPGSIEDRIQLEFDGVSIYRANLPSISLNQGQAVWISFQAVATEATVFVDEQFVGRHLGGWTPFQFELTPFLDIDSESNQIITQEKTLKVVVDEKVGHNTQGFLPIITYHFGGIWQPVHLRVSENATLDRDRIAIRKNSESQTLELEVPVIKGQEFSEQLRVYIGQPEHLLKDEKHAIGDDSWFQLPLQTTEIKTTEKESSSRFVAVHQLNCRLDQLPFQIQAWDTLEPALYRFRVELLNGDTGETQSNQTIDRWEAKIGFRDFKIQADQFLLNGRPVVVRGLLNWGYSPPLLAPSLDESWMRSEIEFAQSRGFNLMKFCLWIPPRRYLELCDQMGMLAWIEYPAWHPKFDQQHLEELKREYQEFFEYDRNYASVVMRSLTCETGPSAELAVIQALYDQCKQAIPGAIVVDDSSWISWNRVFDFYDDHPYGNNHTWVATLTRLKDYIADRTLKPLVLGEAIAADSWTVPSETAILVSQQNPAHGAWAVEDNLRWQTEMEKLAANQGLGFNSEKLLPISLHYGLLMRKFQIEVFHREVPRGGYVVSVIRDFPKAAMGLIDFDNRPKHPASDWNFQGDRMVMLETENDRRSFQSSDRINARLLAKNDGVGETKDGRLRVELFLSDDSADASALNALYQNESKTAQVETAETNNIASKISSQLILSTEMPVEAVPMGAIANSDIELKLPQVNRPTRLIMKVTWEVDSQEIAVNQWPLWIFPSEFDASFKLSFHSSAEDLKTEFSEWFLSTTAASNPSQEGSKSGSKIQSAESGAPEAELLITRSLDLATLDYLNRGGRAILLPNGSAGSFPLRSHWFLRGAPAVFAAEGENWNPSFALKVDEKSVMLTMLAELQHFDLAGDVIPEIDAFLPLVSPRVLLWDNHDMREVKTHGLVFKMEVGKGHLLVSALNHLGETNAVGQWLIKQWCQDYASSDVEHFLTLEMRNQSYQRLLASIDRQEMGLHHDQWRFRPANNIDQATIVETWSALDFDDSDWDFIRIDRHWESQGYPDLDHWAWYRKKVTLPVEWEGPVYLNFNGVDDYAQIYINGKLIGDVGDLQNRITAFDQRISFDISEYVLPDQPFQIAVAVYDWYGAGGIFRPVTISSKPQSADKPILSKE